MYVKKILIFTFFSYLFLFVTNGSISYAAPDISRIQGGTRYETAIEVSKQTYPSGTETVILATGQDFPDALCATPLASMLNAPILTTSKTTLLEPVKQEIQRLGAKNVIILGGPIAVSEQTEQILRSMNLNVERIAGQTRYETSALIASRIQSDTALIANGLNFPDALASAPYAAQNKYPILLTRPNILPQEVRAQIRNKSIILGGDLAINRSLESNFPNVTRIEGQTRYDTNLKIVDYFDKQISKAYLATGNNFADALTGSVLAAKEAEPILLVSKEGLPSSSEVFIKQMNITSFRILGGPLAVPQQTEQALINLEQKYFFAPLGNIEFYDNSNYRNKAGTLQQNRIYSSTGIIDSQFYQFKYGNGNGLINKDQVKTSFSMDEILSFKNEFYGVSSNKSILIDKKNIVVFDNGNNPISTLYSGQRIPIVSETNSHYQIAIGGYKGYLLKQDVSNDNGIPILTYHHILRNEENKKYRGVSTTISDTEFKSQMDLLYRYGYKTITIDELENYLDKNRNLPSKTVAITFDDGLKSVGLYAVPVLRDYQFKATEFIITSRVPSYPYNFNPDDLQFLSWGELNDYADVFNYHSHTHALHELTMDKRGYLVTADHNTVINDLLKSQSMLNNSPYLAYPFGHYTANTINQLKATGYRIGLTTNYGKVKLGDDKYQLKRIGVPPGISTTDFFNKIKN